MCCWQAKIKSNQPILGIGIIKNFKIANQANVKANPWINIDRFCWKDKLNKASVLEYSVFIYMLILGKLI